MTYHGKNGEGTRAVFLGGKKKKDNLKVGEVVPSNYFQLSEELVDLIYVTPKD